MKFKLSMKDLAYWIIILIYTIVIILTVKLGDNASVVDHLSFAGTISSILLAFVAIIYSFVQSISAQVSSNSLINSVSNIESSVKGVSKVEDTLNSIGDDFRELNSELNLTTDKLVLTIGDLIPEIHSKLSNVEKSNSKTIELIENLYPQNEIDINDSSASGGKVTNYTDAAIELLRLSYVHRLILTIFYMFFKLNKSFVLYDITKVFSKIHSEMMKISEEDRKKQSDYYFGTVLCVYYTFKGLSIISFNKEEDDLESVEFFRTEVADYITSSSFEYVELIKNAESTIDKYL